MRLLYFLCCLFISLSSYADSLDSGVAEDSFLLKISEALAAYDIDVVSNLNQRDVVAQRIQRPRLGRFPDLPLNRFPDSEEIENWETEFLSAEVGGLAIIANQDLRQIEADEDFLNHWFNTNEPQRLFVTFIAADLLAAQKIETVVNAYGLSTQLYHARENAAVVGNLYATAAQRLAIDSRAARRYRTAVTELEFLGERVRKNSNSLFSDDGNRGDRSLARREPAVFLKETLGDQFNQSTIREMVVPGGVALGETASLEFVPQELIYKNGELQLVDENKIAWTLPKIAPADIKALFDFVIRSEAIGSDAIVDIDADGRVRISSALRNTDVGFAIMHADTQPFQFVPNLSVTKSVVIDTDVSWQKAPAANNLQFSSNYEVRFLSADNMRIAQTRVALEYQYESLGHSMRYLDAWGRDLGRLDENLDYAGLGYSMLDVAGYAAWVGLLRLLQEGDVSFLRGRYEFMKIDKAGKDTPARY